MRDRSPSYVLGISAFYHDSAACLVRDGEILAAASEERFTRLKGDARFPERASAWCLQYAGIAATDLAAVAFYDKPLLKFERIMETYLGIAPRGFASFLKAGPLWSTGKLFTDRNIRQALDFPGLVLYSEHHEAHAASAFFPSPFQEAAILTVDGVGEWATASVGIGEGDRIRILQELRWPDSLGLLYSAFTYHSGFRVNADEYKIMGLAPYGEPKYVDLIYKELVDLREDGSFCLNQRYFGFLTGLKMTSPAFDALFGGPPRLPGAPLTQREMDLARSVQVVIEEILIRMTRTAHQLTGARHLCLAGGVALNCVANARLLEESPFERIWIQPAAGDAGGALGVALLAWHRHFKGERTVVTGTDAMNGALLGPSFTPVEIERFLLQIKAPFVRPERHQLLQDIARLLAAGKVIGWFDGRMEFGPRALGARSILADPRNPLMQGILNLKVKGRESFRPFAPSVLAEKSADYFDLITESPYMLLTATVTHAHRSHLTEEQEQVTGIARLGVPRSDIPAVTHVDYSARVQTVSRVSNRDFHDLLLAFERLTGCPMLVNTSFNVRDEPMVCGLEDAYRCFMNTQLDALVLFPFLLLKEDQPAWPGAA